MKSISRCFFSLGPRLRSQTQKYFYSTTNGLPDTELIAHDGTSFILSICKISSLRKRVTAIPAPQDRDRNIRRRNSRCRSFRHRYFRRTEFSPSRIFAVRNFRRMEFSPY